MQPMCFSHFTCRMLQKMPGGRQTSWKHDFAAGLSLSEKGETHNQSPRSLVLNSLYISTCIHASMQCNVM